MKKILLVCDQLAESGLRHLLQGQVDAGQFKVFHQKSAAPQLQVITRESAWEATCFLSPEKEKIVQVFILVELNRSDWPSLRSGYTLAEKMLQRDDLKDQILNLQFISLYSRRELRDRAPALHQPFVKYFPHLNYRPKQLLPINFSLREYRFFRNYCLTESGQMDILAHDLRKYTQDSYPAQDLLVQVKRTLELRAAVVGHLAFAKAAQLVAQLELDASPENCRLVQQQHLPVLIELLSQRRDENQAGETPHKMPYKALIVEDDPR
ncbi:MAG: hypothetical protein ABIQ93_02355, partial [Saprospiraceae bacterium]